MRSALDGSDTDALNTANEELMRVSQEVGQALYAATSADQAGQAATGGFAGGAAGSDDDIVDAEVVDEGEDDQGAA